MIAKFKKWWNSERVGRFEEGTSQDMCPTYGSCVSYFLIMCCAWVPLLLVLIFVSKTK